MKQTIISIYMTTICCLLAAHVSPLELLNKQSKPVEATPAQQPETAAPEADQSPSWYSYWKEQAQSISAPYASSAHDFWISYAQPNLVQLGNRGWQALAGLGTAVDLAQHIRKDDPELSNMIYRMCTRRQLAYLWEYNPPVLLTTWLLHKAYVKGTQAFALLTLNRQERIEKLKKEQAELLAETLALQSTASSMNLNDIRTFKINQIADALMTRSEALGEQIKLLQEQVAQEQESKQGWLNTARNYISLLWPFGSK